MGKVDLQGLLLVPARVAAQVEEAVDATSLRIMRHAKQLAPVRNIQGRAGARQALTKAELREQNAITRKFKTVPFRQTSAEATIAPTRLAGREIKLRRAFAQRAAGQAAPLGGTVDVSQKNLGREAYFERYGELSGRGRAELKRGFASGPGTPHETSVIVETATIRRQVTVLRPVKVKGLIIGHVKVKKTEVHKAQPVLQLGGRLRRDIVDKPTVRVGNQIKGGVVSEAPYSRYVEFPTSRTAAQPFMRPALKANRRMLLDETKKRLRQQFG